MNDQEKSGGFCFRCPDQIIDTAKVTQQSHYEQYKLLHNPWPLLAANPDPRQVRVSPFIRTVYFPRYIREFFIREESRASKVKPSKEDIEHFTDNFILTHEWMHLNIMDWTPAKDLARLVLARCYKQIAGLLAGDPVPEALWVLLDIYTDNLNQINESIEFVEELYASARTIDIFKSNMRTGNMWVGYEKVLQKYEERILDYEEQNHQGFREAYHRIQPLFELLTNDPSLEARVIALLEPIEEWESHIDFTQAVDGRKNLMKMLNQPYIKNYLKLSSKSKLRYYNEFKGYLNSLETEQFTRWEQSLAFQVLYAWDEENQHLGENTANPPIVKALWAISHGDLPIKGSFYDAMYKAAITWRKTLEYRTTGERIEPNIYASLELLTNSRGQEFIGIRGLWNKLSGEIGKEMQSHILYLIFLEGIRQQLITKKGLVCPYSQGSHRCACPRQFRNALERLYYLAKDELFSIFDEDEWKPLSCHYSDLWLPS